MVRRSTLALCALPILALLWLGWRQRWVADDAFINFRIVDNLQNGLGPVFNAGERVEAYTSPLWLAVLAAASVVPGSLEWTAVVLGIAATAVGLVAGAHGSWLLWRATGRTGLGLPLGLVVVAALRPMWDFTTSGLETGLTFAWLGASFWALARLHTGASPRRGHALAALLVGLGPLVRPDLAIFAVGFLAGLLLVPGATGRRARGLAAGLVVAPALVYQVFRMGYFAALVPNTALAKEAGEADWRRGLAYLRDFGQPYGLWLPAAALLAFGVLELGRPPRTERRLLAVGAIPVACAVVYAIYIARVGGDFMHGRMLLPSLFGAALPFMVVLPAQRDWRLAPAAAVLVWAIVCAVALRAPYADRATSLPVGDERGFYSVFAGERHPVTLDDYAKVPWTVNGRQLARLAHDRRDALIVGVPMWTTQLQVNGPPGEAARSRVVAGAGAVGLLGYAAGPRVHIVDALGLGDPVASRLRLVAFRSPNGVVHPARVRAGHDKLMAPEWIVARFGPAGAARVPGAAHLSPAWTLAARRALACPDVERLLEATTRPLTAGRFVSNLRRSFSLSSLRIDPDPVRASRDLCPTTG